MASMKKTILFAPMNALGHINAGVGIAQELQSRGHRVVWAIDRTFAGKLTPFGFEEVLVGKQEDPKSCCKEFWQKFMEEHSLVLRADPKTTEGAQRRLKEWYGPVFEAELTQTKEMDGEYKNIVERVKPDLIVVDRYVDIPSLTLSGIPWVRLFSAAPHFAFFPHKSIPPPWAGLPSNKREEWVEYTKDLEEVLAPLCYEVNHIHVSRGGQLLPEFQLHPVSPYLNLYLYPEELDFDELEFLPIEWVRVENILRIVPEQFEIPHQVRKGPGKLIYFSMGSVGCANLELMKKLIGILAKSKNRFIISKGPVFQSYVLPDNMWGQRFLPQASVLPKVDIMITHGGNNSLIEAFYFGKPVLVTPLFGDQLDNAQRVQEKGLGLSVDPFRCTEEDLLGAVIQLVFDEALARRMAQIGDRIRRSEDKRKVSDLIEKLCQ